MFAEWHANSARATIANKNVHTHNRAAPGWKPNAYEWEKCASMDERKRTANGGLVGPGAIGETFALFDAEM